MRIRDRPGEMLAEPRVVDFVAAARCREDDAIGSGKRFQKRRAGRRKINHYQRPLERLKPFGELRVGHVGAAQVESGFLAVECAVADENKPQRIRAVGGLIRESLFQ